MSAAPAGGKLTIQRIGLVGHAVCARATPKVAEGAAEAAIRKFRRDSMMQCGATYVPPSIGTGQSMDFDLVLRDVRPVGFKADQPSTDIGVKDGRIATIAPKLGGSAKEEVQGNGR